MTYNTTTNGALQHESSGNKCLDLFSVIGNLRNCSRADILERFEEAFKENSELAIYFFEKAYEKDILQYYSIRVSNEMTNRSS